MKIHDAVESARVNSPPRWQYSELSRERASSGFYGAVVVARGEIALKVMIVSVRANVAGIHLVKW